MELQSALEEAEATLEQEENKVLRCQMELTQVKTEIERRIAEKDEEFGMVRKNQAKALDSMQAALETESKGKAEALRLMKNQLLNLLQLMPRLLLTAKLLLCKIILRRAVHFLRQQIARDVQLNRNLLIQMKHLLTWEMSTSPLLLLRGSLKQNLTNWGLILMR